MKEPLGCRVFYGGSPLAGSRTLQVLSTAPPGPERTARGGRAVERTAGGGVLAGLVLWPGRGVGRGEVRPGLTKT